MIDPDGWFKLRNRLQSVVEEFRELLGLRDPIRVSEAYFLRKECDREDGPEAVKDTNSPGVYMFYGETDLEKPLYVGKAGTHIGNRVWAHIGRTQKPEERRELPCAEDWIRDVNGSVVIFSLPIPGNLWWLSSALEGYLIEKLKPHKNASGRRS